MIIKNKSKILHLIIVISVILSITAVKLPNNFNFSSIALYLSAIAGYAGIMLMLWTFILGARSIITLFSNDYIKIIKTHSFIGKYGTLLIFLHPLLVMLSYEESLPFIFTPEYGSTFNNAITYGRSAFWIILVIWLTSAFFRNKVSGRSWKYIHLGSYFAIPFALLHVPDTGSSFATLMSAKIYFFIVLIGFVVFSVLRLRGFLSLDKEKYAISANYKSADNIFTLVLKPQTKDFVKIKPGQYVYLKSNRFGEDHPFSILDYNEESGQLVIGYKIYGPFTKKLLGFKNGQELYISKALGTFTSNIDQNPVVFVAGGIGVTPFMPRIIHESNTREQWLFYSNQTKKDSAYIDIIEKSNTKMVKVYTRENYPDSEFGHVDIKMIQKYIPELTNYSFYICGPEKMTRDLIDELKNAGVLDANIHYEIF